MYDLLKKVMSKPRIYLLKKRTLKKIFCLTKIKKIKLLLGLSEVLRDIGGFTILHTIPPKIMTLKY